MGLRYLARRWNRATPHTASYLRAMKFLIFEAVCFKLFGNSEMLASWRYEHETALVDVNFAKATKAQLGQRDVQFNLWEAPSLPLSGDVKSRSA